MISRPCRSALGSIVLLVAIVTGGVRAAPPNCARPLRRTALHSLSSAAEPVRDSDSAGWRPRAARPSDAVRAAAPTYRLTMLVGPGRQDISERRIVRRVKRPPRGDDDPPLA